MGNVVTHGVAFGAGYATAKGGVRIYSYGPPDASVFVLDQKGVQLGPVQVVAVDEDYIHFLNWFRLEKVKGGDKSD